MPRQKLYTLLAHETPRQVLLFHDWLARLADGEAPTGYHECSLVPLVLEAQRVGAHRVAQLLTTLRIDDALGVSVISADVATVAFLVCSGRRVTLSSFPRVQRALLETNDVRVVMPLLSFLQVADTFIDGLRIDTSMNRATAAMLTTLVRHGLFFVSPDVAPIPMVNAQKRMFAGVREAAAVIDEERELTDYRCQAIVALPNWRFVLAQTARAVSEMDRNAAIARAFLMGACFAEVFYSGTDSHLPIFNALRGVLVLRRLGAMRRHFAGHLLFLLLPDEAVPNAYILRSVLLMALDGDEYSLHRRALALARQ